MIVDNISNYKIYESLHPLFKEAFYFLLSNDLSRLTLQKYFIDENNLTAEPAIIKPKEQKHAKLEAHRKYIDIHFAISGNECIGQKNIQYCSEIIKEYDPEKDIMFFNDEPQSWINLCKNEFMILFPDDAHAPGVSANGNEIHKIVLKIKVLK